MDTAKMAPLILLVKLSLRESVSLSGCNEEKSQLQKNVAVIFHIFQMPMMRVLDRVFGPQTL